jgi:hypothetical protein
MELQTPAYRRIDQAYSESIIPNTERSFGPGDVSTNHDSSASFSPWKEQTTPRTPQYSPGWWSSTMGRLDRFWFWEMVGLLGSALTMVAIVVLLDKYNFKRQPTWKTVSLNTVVAWLSVLAKLLVFIPLSTAIGQLKWVWFADGRRDLADLGVFDSASRGVLGSIGLLWRTKGL